MTSILPKGTMITCPRKGHEIGTLTAEIPANKILVSPKHIDFEPGQDRPIGSPTFHLCTECGSKFFVQGMLHTSEGWRPNDPILETPR